jgi:hypothetical protein
MRTSDRTTACDTGIPSGMRRGSHLVAAVLGLGLLVGVGACTGPLDPIITEQPDDRDPTTPPGDGTSFQGWMSEVQFASGFTLDGSPSLG